MSRASGRKWKPARTGEYDPGPGSPEGNAIGESELTDPAGSPVPGGLRHIINYETVQQHVPSPEPPPLYDGMMAHGVPAEPRSEEMQIAAERGTGRKAPRIAPEKPAERPPAVPVYLVEGEGGPSVIRSAHPRQVVIPNNASDAQLLCGRNPNRVRVGLLNEDTATNVRFGNSPGELSNGAGALLPWPTNSYLWLETQDRLYALTTSATLSVTVSVVEEFEQAM
jgi:hypothetical protein